MRARRNLDGWLTFSAKVLVVALVGALVAPLPGMQTAGAAGSAITSAQADAIAIATLHPSAQPGRVVLFKLPRRLSAETRVAEHDPVVATNLPAKAVGHNAWLYWEDLAYGAGFDHPSVLLLVDAASGKVLTDDNLVGWPLVDGARPPFLVSRTGYYNPSFRLYASPSVGNGLPPNTGALAPSASVAAAASPLIPPSALQGECIIMAGVTTDWRVQEDFPSLDNLGNALGIPTYWSQPAAAAAGAPSSSPVTSGTGSDLQTNISWLINTQRCTDIVIFLAGHGSNVSLQPVVTTDGGSVVATDISAVLRAHPATTFKLKIDSCYSGRFLSVAWGLTSYKNLLVVETAASSAEYSYGPLWDKENVRPVPNPGLSEFTNGDLYGVNQFLLSPTAVAAALTQGGSLVAHMLAASVTLGQPANEAFQLGLNNPQLWVSWPTVSSVSPSSGPASGGNVVTVTGSGFTGATSVSFGTTSAAAITIVNDTTINAVVPRGTSGTTVDVTVTGPSGTSAVSTGDRYSYQALPPTVSSVSPSSGPASGGNVVTVTGSGFTGATSVSFGTTSAAAITIVNDTTVAVTAPPGTGGSIVDVTIVVSGSTSAVTPADKYTYTAASAVSFSVGPPGTAAAGAAFAFTVSALTATGAPATGYTGMVHFTSSDPQANLPADTTITNGMGTFSATLKTAGTQSLFVVDATAPLLSATSPPILVNPAPMSMLVFGSLPTVATAGVPFTITITEEDQFGNVSPSSDLVHWTTSDLTGVPPADAVINGGLGSVPFVFQKAGSQTVTAATLTTPAITATGPSILVNPAPMSMLVFGSLPTVATAGVPFTITITEEDQFGNPSPSTAVIHFSSSDLFASVPADTIFSGGTGSIPFTFNTPGPETFTAQTLTTPPISVSSPPIGVSSGVAPSFTLTPMAVSMSTPTRLTFTVQGAPIANVGDALFSTTNLNVMSVSSSSPLFGFAGACSGFGIGGGGDCSTPTAGILNVGDTFTVTVEALSPTLPTTIGLAVTTATGAPLFGSPLFVLTPGP